MTLSWHVLRGSPARHSRFCTSDSPPTFIRLNTQGIFRSPLLTNDRAQTAACCDEVRRHGEFLKTWPEEAPLFAVSGNEVLLPGMVKCVTLEGQSQISAVYDAISNPGNLVAYARMIKPRRATSASMQSPDLNLDLPCLARIVNMESQVFSNKNGRGNRVTIQGEAPIVVHGVQPHSRGQHVRLFFTLLQDDQPEDGPAVLHAAQELEMLLDDVQQLSNKLGYPALELAQSLAWVRTAPLLTNEASRSIPCFPPLVLPDGDELQGGHSKALSLNEGGADLARFSWATRLAFAGLQTVPHMGPQAAFALPGCREAAIATRDTARRLRLCLDVMSEARSVLAAKVAIHSALPSAA